MSEYKKSYDWNCFMKIVESKNISHRFIITKINHRVISHSKKNEIILTKRLLIIIITSWGNKLQQQGKRVEMEWEKNLKLDERKSCE